MEKREIRLADGRYLIFYTFESPMVSCPELDLLVALVSSHPGVAGAR